MKAKQFRTPCIRAAIAAGLFLVSASGLAQTIGREIPGDVIRGVDRGGIALGVVNAISGSDITVNGTVFDATAASITAGGQPATIGQLGPGQIVTVAGGVGSAAPVATAVRFDASLVGPPTAIDLTSSRVIALGQRVVVSATTVFGAGVPGASLPGLIPGEPIVVSGFRDADGTIQATRIDLADTGASPAVIGTIAEVDAGVQQLRINELWVNYSSAAIGGFSGGDPEVGSTVLVSGALLSSGQEMLAVSVARYAPLQSTEGTSLSLEGLVTQVFAVDHFSVGGVLVAITAQTQFEGGSAGDLAVNVKLEIDGVSDATGTLLADRIEFQPDGDLHFAARVQSLGADEQVLQLLGVKLFVNSQTIFKDDLNSRSQSFGIDQLTVGDYVEVSAYLDESQGGLGVAKLARTVPQMLARVEGRLQAFDADARTAVVQGVCVSAEPGSGDIDEFFQRAELGAMVKLEGSEDGQNHVAASVLEVATDSDEPSVLEIEGLVTGVVSPRLFYVGGIVVLANSLTRYENGSAANVVPDAVIKLEARSVNSGLLIAEKIEF